MGSSAVTGHQARPGRGVLVVPDLDTLRGPTGGRVELPLRLFWSGSDRTFDLDRPGTLRDVYETVLREATRFADLTTYLNHAVLVEVWPQLFLPKGVRHAWEDRHPALRRTGATPAA